MAKRTITKLGFVRAPSYLPPPLSLLGIGDNACTEGVDNPAERIDASRRAFTRHSSSSSSSSSSPPPSHSPEGKYVPSSSSSLISPRLSLLSAGSFEINSNCKSPSEARFVVVVVVVVVVVLSPGSAVFPDDLFFRPFFYPPTGGGGVENELCPPVPFHRRKESNLMHNLETPGR